MEIQKYYALDTLTPFKAATLSTINQHTEYKTKVKKDVNPINN